MHINRWSLHHLCGNRNRVLALRLRSMLGYEDEPLFCVAGVANIVPVLATGICAMHSTANMAGQLLCGLKIDKRFTADKATLCIALHMVSPSVLVS